ncbi:hypothetical protein CALVIDRAFT_205331 [Calocera viscosa TUFC12733]|uniref:Uncharacterized protein n=1 Tax=Calocera viscosa (strain TUFC12733) TaxID=1330018 RepID=A0A167KDQ4_CALVF|nr:hypothetical protein CALVIDRAFT_205331 [Calocera viscosa TUFC12733]
MPPPSSSPATPWSIWRTTEPEDRSFTLPHERRHPTQILELSQLLNEVQERTDRVQSSLQRARAPDDVPVIRVEPPRMTQDRGSSRDMPAPLPIFARENSLGLEMEIAPDTANSPRPSNIIAPAPPRSVTPVAGELMVTTELGMTRERMVEALNALHRDRLELRERIITARLAGLTTSHLEEAARQLRSASHGLRGGIAAEARARQIAPNRSGSAALLASRPVAHRRNTSDERGQAEFVRLMSETEPLLAEHRRTGAAIRQLVGERTVDVTQDPLTSVVNPGPSIGPLTRQDAERVARDAARDAARAEDFLRAYRLEAPAQFGRERITGADAGRDSVLRRRMPAYLRSSVDGESNPRPHDPSRANSPSPPPVPPRPSPSSRYDPVRDTDRDVHMESARPRMRAVPLTPMGVDYPLYNGRNVATFRQQVRSRERPSSSFSAVSSLQNTVATQASSATDPHLERLSARNAVLQEELRSRTAALEASTQERDRAYIRSRLRRWDDNMSSSRPGERPPSLFSSTLVTDDDMDISSDTEGLATATSTAPGRRSRLAPPRLEAGRDVQSGAEQLRENLRQRREQRRNEHVLRQRTVHRYRPETSEDSEARDRRMRAYESSWTNILAERQARQGQPTPTSQPRATTSQTNLATPTSGTSRPTINVPPSRNDRAS